MKKTVSLLLALLLLLPLATACSHGERATVESKTEATQTAQAPQSTELPDAEEQKIPAENRLSKEKIASFPIANNAMSEEELRALCVDFFRFSQTFAWTPDEDWKYGKDKDNPNLTLTAGTVYGGFPYLLGTGNVYRIAEFYDEKTGVVTMSGAGANQRLFGNFCSYGSGWGFSRVVNSAKHGLTESMVPKNGYIPVGPYKIDPNLEKLEKNATVEICKANGKEVMFASYAKLRPADALVTFSSGGHVIMCSEIEVFQKADGSVDPDRSYLKYIDQIGSWSFHKLANGKSYQVQGGVDKTLTFSKLFAKHYIPYTFGEFLGTDPVEKGEATIAFPVEEPTVEQLSGSILRANYMVSDVFLEILDKNGKVVLKNVTRTSNGGVKEVKLAPLATGIPQEYASRDYNLRIRCQLGNGELLTAWNGHLSPG